LIKTHSPFVAMIETRADAENGKVIIPQCQAWHEHEHMAYSI